MTRQITECDLNKQIAEKSLYKSLEMRMKTPIYYHRVLTDEEKKNLYPDWDQKTYWPGFKLTGERWGDR